MPTYQYACTACDERLEVVQSFSDAALTECPTCTGPLRKVFSAVGVVFKGSGFYKTDSRGAKGEGKADGKGEGKTNGKAETKAASGGDAGGSGATGSGSSSGGSAGGGSGSSSGSAASSASAAPKVSAPASKSA